MTATERRIASGDLYLHSVADGNPRNPALVLVHGYPDNHRVWDRLVPLLAREFFVIRYDVRGAGLSDKPRRTRDYRLPLLSQDLAAVVDAWVPGQPFHLAAHDWGSIQSWESVTSAPLNRRLLSYTSVSGPCLDHVGYWLRSQIGSLQTGGTAKVLRQLASSWYVFLFQLPILPEALWTAGLDRLWPGHLKRHEGVEDAGFSPLQKADGRYGVKLYRANMLPRTLKPSARYSQCPVQVVIPRHDRYVGPQLAETMVRWTGKLTRTELDAPHWAPLTAPEAMAGAIGQFARQHPEVPAAA
ncbi:alpha/beta fold hydrolase [Marinobacter sp. C2H3]|uniref:alpha/beta fold hydrolase n=1 Tax=Marinobacter sp. C2H3 TaxID=3119003 RepID=UPI00300F4DB9